MSDVPAEPLRVEAGFALSDELWDILRRLGQALESMPGFCAPVFDRDAFSAAGGQDGAAMSEAMALQEAIRDRHRLETQVVRCLRERGCLDIRAADAVRAFFAAEIERCVALRETHADVDAILESMGDAFFALDAHWTILRVNHQHEKTTRIPRDQQIGKNFLALFLSDAGAEQTQLWQQFHRSMRDRVPVYFEDYYEPLCVWSSVNTYVMPDGGMAVFYRDITSQKSASRRVAEERQKLEAIFHDSHAGMAILRGSTFIFERVNAQWEGLVSAREYVGKTWRDAYPEVDAASLLTQMKRVFDTGEPFAVHEVKIRVKGASGFAEDRYYDYSYVRIIDAAGAPYGIYSQTLDVTEKVRSRLHVEENEHRLKMALAGAQLGTWAVDLPHMTLRSDARFRDLHDAGDTELPYDIFQGKVHPDDRASTSLALNQAIAAGSLFSCEYRVVQKNGQYRWVSARGEVRHHAVTLAPLEIAGVVMDISDVKLAEDGLKKAVKARDVFLGIASHELKTPLTSWKLQSQMYQRRLSKQGAAAFTDDVLTKMFDASSTQIDRLIRLVDDMLDVSRIASGNLSMVFADLDVSALFHETIKKSQPLLHSVGCKVEAFIEDEIVTVADACRLEQVLVNLLANVVKYAPGKPVSVSLSSDADAITLRVQDNGPGIPAAMREVVFERFERLVPASEVSGLGLGLPIVREIIRAHGGDACIQATCGAKGCLFVLTWPRRAPTDVRAATRDEARSSL